jgi:hypothetical protein
MGKWKYSSTTLDLRGSRPRYPLDWRLGGPQSRSGCCEAKNLSPAGIRTPAVQPVALRAHMYIWRLQIPPKRWYVDNELHIFLAVPAVRHTKIDGLTVYIPEILFCRMNSESTGLLLVFIRTTLVRPLKK